MSTIDEGKFNNGRGRLGLLTTLTLLSGCCGLAYEVLYVRALTAVLGDMFYVHAALLSTFLVGIGLGAKLAHRWLRWLWVFETLTGLCALALPIASRWFSQQPIMTPVTSSPTLTILATVCFISVPGLLIGFSIPLFSAYIKARSPERLSFQWVYRVYNLGAVFSILGVELVLIRYLGIRLSLAIIGAINLFNGAVLLLTRAAPERPPAVRPRSFLKRSVVALAMASLCSAVFQMFFLKLSYLVFYPHRENFAIGLSVTMLGIFLGAWLASKVKIRFETFLVLAAVLIGLIYVNYLPILRLFETTADWAKSSTLLILAHKFFFGCLFALGPMVLFGALIPALMRTESEVAGESGHLLWVSSLANATGYLVYVLIGHPLLTSGVLLALIAGILLLASLLAAGLRFSKLQAALAMGSIVLVVLLAFGWQDRNFYLAHWVNELKPEDEVTVFKSGAESATLVRTDRVFKSRHKKARPRGQEYKSVWQDVWISYNGYPSITIQRNEGVNYAEIMVGIIPALTSPRLDRAMVIGLGTGITAGATSQAFKSTDVVEINNAFYKMMPSLSYANFDIEHNPSAVLHLSDGRAFLVGKKGCYDVIINTVSAPTYFSASKIYTVDFYKQVRKSLKHDGIFCTWISAANMSEAGMLTILSALRHSFSYCELRVIRAQYYLLTCSNQPIRSRRQFSKLLPPDHYLTRQLQRNLPGLDLDEFFDDILLSRNIFENFTPQVPQENTDDHPVLEFMVVRSWQLNKMGSDPFTHNQASLNIEPLRRDELKTPARFARRAATFWRLGSDYFDSFQPVLMKDPNVAPEFFLQAAEYKLTDGEPAEAVELLTTALKIRPDFAEAHNNLATILQSQGKLDKAISHFRKALQSRGNFAEAHNNLGTLLQSQGRLDEAVSHFRSALQARPDFVQAYNNLGNALASQGKLEEAIQTFHQALACSQRHDLKGDMADIHFSLAMALKKSGKIQQARQQLAGVVEVSRSQIANDPRSIEMHIRLGDALAELGNLAEAAVCFGKAVDLNPVIPDNQLKLIHALESQGRLDEAAKAARKAIQLFSKLGNNDAADKLQQYLKSIGHES